MSLLPESFQPSDTEVVVGRGKRCAEHPGNKRLREIVQAHVPEYAKTSTKREKTRILNTVVRLVRSNSAQQAGFVKENKATGRWNIVEDSAARITTAQVFRDTLHTHYKSSKQFKQQRRQDERESVTKMVAFPQQTMATHSAFVGQPLVADTTPLAPGLKDEWLRALSCLQARVPLTLDTASLQLTVYHNQVLSSLMDVLDKIDVDLSEDPFEPTPLSSGSASDAKLELLRRERGGLVSGSTQAVEDIRSQTVRPRLPAHENGELIPSSSSVKTADQAVSADGNLSSVHAPHLTCKRRSDDTTDGFGCMVDLQFNHYTSI